MASWEKGVGGLGGAPADLDSSRRSRAASVSSLVRIRDVEGGVDVDELQNITGVINVEILRGGYFPL